MDLVSVVIPTFNRVHCVGNAIDSALAQTYRNVEVIVVDDGSTDGTAEMIGARYAEEPRVRQVRKANGGVSSARNAGFEVAAGAYIALLDSDDSWVPWKTQLQVACMERYPDVGMIWTDMSAVDAAGNVFAERYLRMMYSAWDACTPDQIFSDAEPLRQVLPQLAEQVGECKVYCGRIFSRMITGSLVHTSTVMLRRERLQQTGGFNVDLLFSGEDYEFHLRTCRMGPVAFADIPTTRYQRGMADALTRREYRIHLAANFLRTIEHYIGRYRDEIELPDATLRSVRAEAHAWLADADLDMGELEEARAHFRASLRLRPWQPNILVRSLFASLPAGVQEPIRALLRRPPRLASPRKARR